MSLTSKQKHFIKKNYSRLSINDMAQELGASQKEIEKFIAKKIGKNKISHSNKKAGFFMTTPNESFHWKSFIVDNSNYFTLLFILIIVVYFNSLDNTLVSDDIPIIAQDNDIKHIAYLLKGSIIGLVRKSFYFIFYALTGPAPFLFHIFNLFFHFGAVFLSFILLSRIANRTIAIFSSCLLAVHPLMIESVSWISGGNYSEYAFFVLLSFLIYLTARNKNKLILALFLFFMALLSSEKAIVFPGILLAYELSQSRLKEMWKRLIPYFSLFAFWALLLISRIGQRVTALETTHYQSQQGMLNPLVQIPIAIVSYLKLIFWPSGLTLYHTEMSFSTGQYILTLLIFLVYLGSIFYFYQKNKFLFFWLSFLIITLLPTLTPLGISWIVAERYAYLGALGMFSVIAYFFYYLLEKFNAQKNILYASFAIIILALSIRTVIRNMDWQNEDTLWIATAKTSPSGPNIHNNLGDVYARQGDLEKAATEFKKATEINPGYADAYHNLANTHAQMKNFEEATINYKKALEINPRLWQSHQQLAAIYFEQENYSAALDEIKKALEINPADKNLNENLKIIKSKYEAK